MMTRELAEKIVDKLIDLSCDCPSNVQFSCGMDCEQKEAKECWIKELMKVSNA